MARLLFRELLDAQWSAGELPADPEQLRALAGFSPDEFAGAWRCVERHFPEIDGARVCEWLDKQRVSITTARRNRQRSISKTNRDRYGKVVPIRRKTDGSET